MKLKRMISGFTAGLMFSMSLSGFSAYAADGAGIKSLADLQAALNGTFSGSCRLENDIDVTNSGITASVTIDGNGHALNSTETRGDSAVYQNENVNSEFKNLVINGNTKPEVGIWEGCGTMTLTDCTVQNYNVSTVRRAAVGVGSSGTNKQGILNLNNVAFKNNGDFDINISDAATLNINSGTTLDKVRLQSSTSKLNIGESWSGEFEITMDSPSSRTLGTVADTADISGITVSNTGYYVENQDGALVIQNDNGSEIHFDMNSRSKLHHGSTGFLYGQAEINVPTIDLLQGLKPSTMVQKALGGLQHPTGDAIRTRSSVEAGGAKNIQVYLQDIYLEWPYNAPYNADGSLNVDGYTKTCEEILYGMICDKADSDTNGAFLGSDGNYYVLNKAEAQKYSYVLFNEPDNIWYRNNLSGLEAAWKQVYEAVHRIDPDAKCAGPNFAGFNASKYDSFLSYCYTNNCLPEIITWHELGDASLTSFYDNYNSVQNSASKYYTDAYASKSGRSYQPELLVNEYARHYDIGAPGGLVKWLSMFEDKDMDSCMAYWAMANSLNEMAADQNSPASTWWVYHWYAQMTGEQCALTAPAFADTRFYGTAAYDDEINMAYVLFGGSEEKHGKETVYLNNMDSTKLVGENGAANVRLYGVSFSGQQGTNYKPEVVFDGAVNVSGNTLKIQVTDTDEMDAFFAVVTPSEQTGTAMKNVRISTLSYEAEEAELLGGAKAYDKVGWSTFAASGRKDVGSINNNGDGVKFTVNVPKDGTYDVGLFYSLQAPYVNAQTLKPDSSGQNRAIGQKLPFGMQVDNGETITLYLDTTVTWNYRAHHNTDVYLTAGEHTLTFTQINGDEGSKGNLQLSATVDKLDLDYIENSDTRYDFEVDLSEQKAFKENDAYRVTAVAPKAGYYNITGDGEFTLKKQSVDYTSDAKSYSRCSTYDNDGSNIVYLSQGANTLVVTGNVKVLTFAYDAEKTERSKTVVNAENMTIYGTNAYHRDSAYSESGKVVTELGIGQNAAESDKAEDNYIEFNVNAQSAGVYNIAVRYANDEPAPVMQKTDGSTYVHPYNIDLVERYAQIKVNDNAPETVYFRNTMSWDTFKTVDVQVQLNAGENTVRIYNDNSYQFSSLVNSTAPEIDTITISKQSYDGTAVTASSKQESIDTSKLDEIIVTAQEKMGQQEEYSEKTLAELKAALDGVKRDTQSDVNQSYITIKNAIAALKPASLNLKDYYVTSYASTNKGTPENSFDGDESTMWTVDRSASPYVGYEVFYAGDGKVFDLSEITMQGDNNAKVIYLGTNSDDILKTPAEINPDSGDLAKKDSELYRPFAQMYSADVIGSGSGTNAVTQLSGKYRYLIVGATTWSVTNVKELALSARIEDAGGSGNEGDDTEKTPVLWYEFNDGAADSSGNDLDGTVNGAVIKDSTAVFDGTDDYIKMPDGILKNADSATVAIYLKPGIEKQNQFTWCIGNSSTTGYMFLNTYNPNSKLRAAITKTDYKAEEELASSSYAANDEWISIIAVFDGANSVLYRDGKVVAQSSMTIKPSDLGATTANYIAKSVYNDPYFRGAVSDFRIYDKALTAEEARKLAEEQKNSYAKTAPDIVSVTGSGIKSYGVEIDTLNNTVFMPIHIGTDMGTLAPEFSCERDAEVILTSGTYANGVITVTDKADASLSKQWTITAEERGNAVLDGYYADPNIACFNGKYYIYPTTDGGSGWDAPYFKCFSSDDLVHWTDEGVILDLKDVSWSNGKNGWAPTIAEKNGKYYFYYSAAPAGNGAKNLAVAVADSPTGPFEDKGVIVEGGSLSGQMIDSAVFTDDDGQSYLYWGNGSMYGAKLSEDMLSIEQDTIKKLNPSNFREGSFMIKRDGKYYMMWSDDDTGSPDYQVRYGMMDSPLGTITGNTLILTRKNADNPRIKGTGHHSVVNVPGTDEWYICYHRFNTALYGNQETQSSAAGNHREVCIDKLEFDANGNIKPVTATAKGITEPVNVCKAEIIITPDGDKVYADFNVNITGEKLYAYFASYDKATNALISVKKSEVIENSLRIEMTASDTVFYKAFLWNEQHEPICKCAEK